MTRAAFVDGVKIGAGQFIALSQTRWDIHAPEADRSFSGGIQRLVLLPAGAGKIASHHRFDRQWIRAATEQAAAREHLPQIFGHTHANGRQAGRDLIVVGA
jgi:hypothetical protein